jgi:hypothetical protein
MKPKREPSEAEFAMLDAMFSKNPAAWDDWVRSQGYEPDQDLPVCLANIPPAEWQDLSKVIPTPGVQAYLNTGDLLTNHTLDMMELALERDYAVTEPWFIDCERTGRQEDETLQVTCFRLCKQV